MLLSQSNHLTFSHKISKHNLISASKSWGKKQPNLPQKGLNLSCCDAHQLLWKITLLGSCWHSSFITSVGKSIMLNCKRSFQFSQSQQPLRCHLHLADTWLSVPILLPSVVPRNRHWGRSYMTAHEASNRTCHQDAIWELVASGIAWHLQSPYKASKCKGSSCATSPQVFVIYVSAVCMYPSLLCGQHMKTETRTHQRQGLWAVWAMHLQLQHLQCLYFHIKVISEKQPKAGFENEFSFNS